MTRAANPPPDMPRFVTLDEYFALDEASDVRLEFFGVGGNVGQVTPVGEVVAMAGGTSEHALITVNVGGELRQRLKGTSCRVFSPDKRVGAPGRPVYAYPDVSVICGPEQNDPNDPDQRTAVNPILVVEVLSRSTERVDRGRKFAQYLAAPSLMEYVLVSQGEPRVEWFYRQPDGQWLFSYVAGLDATVRLRSVRVELPLAEIYLNVTFPAAGTAAADV